MFGHQRRLITFHDTGQTFKVVMVQGVGAAYGQANAMDRKRIVLGNGGKVAMGWAAGAHIVLGVDLEKPKIGAGFQNLAIVVGFKADTSAGRHVEGVVFLLASHGVLYKIQAGAAIRTRLKTVLRRYVAVKLGKAAHTVARKLHGNAGSRGYQLEGIALIVNFRGARTGGAGAGLAVILAGHGNAIAFFFGLGRCAGNGN